MDHLTTASLLTCRTEISLHSRAARRGASPPAKQSGGKAPVEETEYKPWLHSAQNTGISKRKTPKQLSRQQKVRQQKALEKADIAIDKLMKKVADSNARDKKAQGRRKDWDELNQKISNNKLREGEMANAVQSRNDLVKEATEGLLEDMQLVKSELPLSLRMVDEDGHAGEDATVVYADNRTAADDDEVL